MRSTWSLSRLASLAVCLAPLRGADVSTERSVTHSLGLLAVKTSKGT